MGQPRSSAPYLEWCTAAVETQESEKHTNVKCDIVRSVMPCMEYKVNGAGGTRPLSTIATITTTTHTYTQR